MRIGEAAKQSGVSARMVRYYDRQGYLRGRDRGAGRHRQFDEEDLQWLRTLNSLLVSGVPAAAAVRVLRGTASGDELRQADQTLARTSNQADAARRRVAPVGQGRVLVEHQFRSRLTCSWPGRGWRA